MTSSQEAELMEACRILFPIAEINRDFLCYIQPEGVKNAYRNRAWECHPDACGHNGDQFSRTEQFRRSVEAYNLLNEYLKERKQTIRLRHAGAGKPSSPRKTIIERAGNERYFDGPLPTIELKTGLYLYYSQAVSYQAVVRALMWQRDLRPPLGDFACKWGWLTEADVSTILHATHIVGSFGERAVAMGLLSESQLKILLLHQRSLQLPIGRYFVAHSLLSELSLLHFLREHDRHNRQVGKTRNYP